MFQKQAVLRRCACPVLSGKRQPCHHYTFSWSGNQQDRSFNLTRGENMPLSFFPFLSRWSCRTMGVSFRASSECLFLLIPFRQENWLPADLALVESGPIFQNTNYGVAAHRSKVSFENEWHKWIPETSVACTERICWRLFSSENLCRVFRTGFFGHSRRNRRWAHRPVLVLLIIHTNHKENLEPSAHSLCHSYATRTCLLFLSFSQMPHWHIETFVLLIIQSNGRQLVQVYVSSLRQMPGRLLELIVCTPSDKHHIRLRQCTARCRYRSHKPPGC